MVLKLVTKPAFLSLLLKLGACHADHTANTALGFRALLSTGPFDRDLIDSFNLLDRCYLLRFLEWTAVFMGIWRRKKND